MSKKRNPLTARRIHLWVAVILAIPMLLMAATGIMIAMRSMTKITVPMSWMGAETVPERLPVTAFAETAGGVLWIGNAQGLYRVAGGSATTETAFAGQEVVAVARVGERDLPLVATRMAVWSNVDGTWQAVRRGRVRQLSTLSDGRVLAISGGRGEMADGKAMITADGSDWKPHGALMRANKLLPPLDNPSVQLHQFMRELHSGAYFFGKGTGEMVWSNIMGWVLVLLSLTGLWMWALRERRKVAELRAALQRQPHIVAVPGE